jgi:hypothetical protein
MLHQLPENIVQMMKRGEVSPSGMEEVPKEERTNPAYIRRSYLMDMYRFFMLFPNNKCIYNPYVHVNKEQQFAGLFITSALFLHTPMDERKPSMVKLLKKRKLDKAFEQLMMSIPREMRDVNYYLWKGDFERALELDPENERALAGHARNRFKVKDYDAYSSFFVNISGLNGKPLVIQMLNSSDKVYKEQKTSNGQAEFYYVTPGTYYLRLFVDENNNGLWDCGNYERGLQPEQVYYFHEEIECRAKWDVTREWNPLLRSLNRQKPAKITQQKADKERTVKKNRNAERAKAMGIPYIPQDY